MKELIFIVSLIGIATFIGTGLLVKSTRTDLSRLSPAISNDVVTVADSDCGSRALLRICELSSIPLSVGKSRRLTRTTEQGTTMLDLMHAARLIGFDVSAVRATFEDLQVHVSKHDSYAIIYLSFGHFSAVAGSTSSKNVRLIDEQIGDRNISKAELASVGWRGEMLLLSDHP